MSEENLQDRIWKILDGIPFVQDNLTIRTTRSDKLLVTSWISTIDFENINKEDVLKALDELKAAYLQLAILFHDLNDIVKNNRLTIEYHISYKDADNVCIGLCSEIAEQLFWYF